MADDIKSMNYAAYAPKPHGGGVTGPGGLLRYRKWWERDRVDICVGGELVSGTPIFVEGDTLRLVNSQYSYFIPLEKIDYIRTSEGLCSSFECDA